MANTKHKSLLDEVEAFISETEMGASYFGKKAASNSELVERLRNGGRVWPETEAKIRAFILHRRSIASVKAVSANADIQGRARKNRAGAA